MSNATDRDKTLSGVLFLYWQCTAVFENAFENLFLQESDPRPWYFHRLSLAVVKIGNALALIRAKKFRKINLVSTP